MGAPHFFIIAGEPSGDNLAAGLMRALKTDYPGAAFTGMGGPAMVSEGLRSNYDYSQLQIVGVVQVLTAYGWLKSLMNKLVEEVIETRPQAVFTVDAKGFSLRFAQALRKRMAEIGWQVPIIHMVAPTIWAWGKWRARKFEANFDALLCLFPMEPALFDEKAIKTAFIGHYAGFKEDQRYEARDPHCLLMMPGSRRSELSYILPTMLEAANKLVSDGHIRRIILPALPHLSAQIDKALAGYDLPIEVLYDNGLDTGLKEAGFAFCTSGTATLELAIASMPAITGYRVSALNAIIMPALAYITDPILPHILLKKKIYPYFFQNELTAENLLQAAHELQTGLVQKQTEMRQHSDDLRQLLTNGAPDFEASIQKSLSRLFPDGF